jgi:hypothetical protein
MAATDVTSTGWFPVARAAEIGTTPVPWAVEERHGWVWLALERTAIPSPPRPSAHPTPEPVPAPPDPSGPVFGNLAPS